MAAAPHLDLFDRLSSLADPTRSRILLLLEGRELTVGELCAVLQLPQSTVSRHLKVLSDDGWAASRAEGTSRLYRMEPSLDAGALRLWQTVRDEMVASPAASQDLRRLASVIAARRSRSRAFFSGAAGEWDALRSEMFGRSIDFALLGLLNERWVVGDLGCGTGRLAGVLAPFVRQVVAVDASAEMLDAARERLEGTTNVELRSGDLEQLPIADGELDVAVLALVLHYVTEPARALAEAHRALQPDGRLLIVDMMPHAHEEYRQTMGHLWLGFPEDRLGAWLREAGFRRIRYQPLPADPAAKGPTLFVATGRAAK